jgi:hypothetical protein
MNKPHLIQEPTVKNLKDITLTSLNVITPKITIIIYECAIIQTAIRLPKKISKIQTDKKLIKGKKTNNIHIKDILI